MEKKMDLPCSEPEAIRELSNVELDNVSGGNVVWGGAIIGPAPVS